MNDEPHPSSNTPLGDLLVVDLSRVLAGPYAAMMLGDLGARVIKVERPEGDDTRAWGPPFVGDEGALESIYFLSTNRNKESIVLDFKDAADLRVLERLVARADVLIENFRPKVLEKFNLGAEAARAEPWPDRALDRRVRARWTAGPVGSDTTRFCRARRA